jgi:hypothetical protein
MSAFQSSAEVGRVLFDGPLTRPASAFDIHMIFTGHRAYDHRVDLLARQNAVFDQAVRDFAN